MVNVWTWAFVAALLPVIGGPYLTLWGARPDTALAFMAAGAAGRRSVLGLLPVLFFFCTVRFVLEAPDARSDAIGLGMVSCALLTVAALRPARGAPAVLFHVTWTFFLSVLFFAVWRKGSGLPASLPPIDHLLRSLLFTGVLALAFSRAIEPEGAEP